MEQGGGRLLRDPAREKFGIKPGYGVGLVNAPDPIENRLDGLPASVKVSRVVAQSGAIDVLICFFSQRLGVAAAFPSLLSQ